MDGPIDGIGSTVVKNNAQREICEKAWSRRVIMATGKHTLVHMPHTTIRRSEKKRQQSPMTPSPTNVLIALT